MTKASSDIIRLDQISEERDETMKRSFKLKDLDCANCAAKMECDINKLEGVNKANISFMTSKLVIDSDSGDFDSVLDKAQSICSKYEPDCVIVR